MYRFHTKLMCWVLTQNPASLCSKQQIAIACLGTLVCSASEVSDFWVISGRSLGDLGVTPECSLCDLWVCSQLPFKVSESTLCCIGHVLLIWNEYCDTGVGLSENLSIKAPWGTYKVYCLEFCVYTFWVEKFRLGGSSEYNSFFVVQSLHSVCWNFAVHWAEFNGI